MASGRGGRPAAGGGRWIDVPPARLERWLAGFAERHGPVTVGAGFVLTAADGSVAHCHPPFPPVDGDDLPALLAHARQDRRVGVLLVRLGGFAVGVFAGPTLVTSKVDTRLVHGRNKAGGWSQQRFARRREGQARQLTDAATAVAARILVPEAAGLDAVVLGGDKASAETVLSAPALRPLVTLRDERFLTVPDPRRDVLEATPDTFRAVRIRLLDAVP